VIACCVHILCKLIELHLLLIFPNSPRQLTTAITFFDAVITAGEYIELVLRLIFINLSYCNVWYILEISTEMNSEFEIKDTEKTPMAPTVSIEQISIVRPIKVRMLTCHKAVGRGYWRGRGNETQLKITVIIVIIWN